MSLSNAQKAVVSFVFLLGAVAALVIPGYNIGLTDAVSALIGPVFAVIGVFAAQTFSPETFEKSLMQLWGAATGVIGFFTEVPASTDMKVVVLIGAIASVAAVIFVKNRAYVYGVEKKVVYDVESSATTTPPVGRR